MDKSESSCSQDMKKKRKKANKIPIEDYIKAVKKANRDVDLEQSPGWKRITSIHRNKKVYNRKREKKNIPEE